METYKIYDFNIIKSVFWPINANMYVIIENHNALVFDPHVSQDILNLLKANSVNDVTVILTHEHPDHTSGVNWLSEHFATKLICQENCAKSIADKKNNRPVLISLILAEQDKINGTNESEKLKDWFTSYDLCADITFSDEFEYNWGLHKLVFKHTPGHSIGSCCIILDDCLFITGDSVLKDYPIITRFPGGSKKDYNNIVIPFLKSLDTNLNVLPGHGNIFKLYDLILEDNVFCLKGGSK